MDIERVDEISRLGVTLASFVLNQTATTFIYTLSLHDALPIFVREIHDVRVRLDPENDAFHRAHKPVGDAEVGRDRKSTRLNSSHQIRSYAGYCLKKKRCS